MEVLVMESNNIERCNKVFDYNIGDRGLKLSGGQKQRVGLARALYNNNSLIALDEATSALDNDTEKLVMNAIEKLGQDKTIILIAHRLSTLKNCDKIFLMEKGEMKREMTYKELNETEFNLQQNLNDKSKFKFIN